MAKKRTPKMREYMKALKSADDSQLGLVRFGAAENMVANDCEIRGWARWGGKRAKGAPIMFLTTKGLRAMQYHGWTKTSSNLMTYWTAA